MNKTNIIINSQDIFIPVCIINDKILSPLEAIVKYLKEEKGLRITDIATLTNRDERAIGVTYHRAIKKSPNNTILGSHQTQFPIKILANKKLSVLEQIVIYIFEQYSLRLRDIAILTGKDNKTIWTIHNRAKNKLNGKV